MSIRNGARTTTDAAVHAYSAPQWAILVGIVFLPQILRLLTPFVGFSSHQHIVLAKWAYPLATVALLMVTSRIGQGSFAKLATKRMWAPTGTPLLLTTFVPVVLTLVFVAIQGNGLGKAALDTNIFEFKYKGVFQFYAPQVWFGTWLAPICGSISFIWLLMLVLSNANHKVRIGLSIAVIACLTVFSGLSQFELAHFYPGTSSHFPFYAPSMAWWFVTSMGSIAASCFLFVFLERVFRPSLLPVLIYLVTTYLYGMMFGRPTGPYEFAAQLLSVVIVWLCLKRSRVGIEKWSEYQRELETVRA